MSINVIRFGQYGAKLLRTPEVITSRRFVSSKNTKPIIKEPTPAVVSNSPQAKLLPVVKTPVEVTAPKTIVSASSPAVTTTVTGYVPTVPTESEAPQTTKPTQFYYDNGGVVIVGDRANGGGSLKLLAAGMGAEGGVQILRRELLDHPVDYAPVNQLA